jgi:PPK2 family polyphosphate:nucleotide phosphotransferase
MKAKKKRSAPLRRIDTRRFRVPPARSVDLDHWPTRVPDFYRNKDDAQDRLQKQVERTAELQELLYAGDSHALLLIFQAMDAAGKDGAIKHVMSGVNPQGCQVSSFKQPSQEELDHDFLWRSSLRLPERGRIGIFNRSYYEEVLVVRVHPEYLGAQRLPDLQAGSQKFWDDRLRSIREHEAHLQRNGTVIVKFFLHLSKAEQCQRFLERIEDPGKHWKFSMGDVEERRLWDNYMRAYGQALTATSTRAAPWYVVPADDKKNARLIISQIVNETMEGMKLAVPKPDRGRLSDLKAARQQLLREQGRKVVERKGIEPSTFALRTRRSPN